MKPILILSDVHLGVTRQAGTTLHTQKELQRYLQESFNTLIHQNTGLDLMILGDLFDDFNTEPRIVLETFYGLADWIQLSHRTIYLVAGNHDWSPKADRLSSFHFLAKCLSHAYPENVVVIDQPTMLCPEESLLYVIPHMPNQDLFERALEMAEQTGGGALLLHCNVMSPFAQHSDHSLDINEAWVKRLTAKFQLIILGHEHQHRTFACIDGEVRTTKAGEVPQVVCLGNQWPSSVIDCLSQNDRQADGIKYGHILSLEDKLHLDRFPTWWAEQDFRRIDWHELHKVTEWPRFVRVEGMATALEAPDVMSKIAKARQGSPSLVITNGVKIEGQAGVEDAAKITFENLKGFNVMDALLSQLEPAERQVILEVMEDDQET